MKLRDYQNKAVEAVLKAKQDGNRSALIVLPTGCGKTIIFSSLIKRMLPGRSMVIAHRRELVWQAVDKIKSVTGASVDVEMGEYRSSLDANLFSPRSQVVVSTVQTHTAGGDGAGRIGKFDPKDFSLLVFDESHHATSSSWRKIRDYYFTNENVFLVGVTATPDRADEEALGQVFDTVAFEYDLLNAIQDGWLVNPHQQHATIESLDFSSIRTTAGDLNSADLDAIMRSEKPLHAVASTTIESLGERQGLGFAASVEHARMLCNIFNRHKAGMSAFVYAGTGEEERKHIVNRFKSGDIQFVWNCGIFTEGADFPNVSLISIARPTKSRALYAQMIGRGTRPHSSIADKLGMYPIPALRKSIISNSPKKECIVLDFVGNSGRHKLVGVANILGGKYSQETIDKVVEFSKKSHGPVRVDKMLEEEEKKLEEQKKESERRRLEEESGKLKIIGKAKYKLQDVNPFDLLQIKPAQPRGWDKGKELSEKQKAILRKFGFNPNSMPYEQSKQLINIIFDRMSNNKCSIGQAKLLDRYGYSTELGFDDAKKVIDAIAKNHWKKPLGFSQYEKAKETKYIPNNNEHDEDDNVPF